MNDSDLLSAIRNALEIKRLAAQVEVTGEMKARIDYTANHYLDALLLKVPMEAEKEDGKE